MRRTLLAIFISLPFAGCGIQDSTQPPENSISAGKNQNIKFFKVKTKKTMAAATATGKTSLP